jgi:hypothetical protein
MKDLDSAKYEEVVYTCNIFLYMLCLDQQAYLYLWLFKKRPTRMVSMAARRRFGLQEIQLNIYTALAASGLCVRPAKRKTNSAFFVLRQRFKSSY